MNDEFRSDQLGSAAPERDAPTRHRVAGSSSVLAGMVGLMAFVPLASLAAQCAPDGDVRFVCGVPGAEDLIAVPGTPWVLASSRISDDDGHVRAVDVRDHSTTILFPGSTSRVAPDAGTYASCPGAPTSGFQPHGIALRPGDDGVHTFYLVGHGPRESVEVFHLDATVSPPRLTWTGCMVAPEGVSLNSVTPLPGGAIAVTNFDLADGELWEWRPSAGWSEVPGSEMPGPNGVTSSEDGDWLYVGGYGDEALVRVSREPDPDDRGSVGVGFHSDNVRWAPDGSLLVAGQTAPSVAAVVECLDSGSCEGIATRVAKVDPASFEGAGPVSVEHLVDYPSNELLPLGTVAIQVGDEIWVGGIAGGDRIARFPVD